MAGSTSASFDLDYVDYGVRGPVRHRSYGRRRQEKPAVNPVRCPASRRPAWASSRLRHLGRGTHRGIDGGTSRRWASDRPARWHDLRYRIGPPSRCGNTQCSPLRVNARLDHQSMVLADGSLTNRPVAAIASGHSQHALTLRLWLPNVWSLRLGSVADTAPRSGRLWSIASRGRRIRRCAHHPPRRCGWRHVSWTGGAR